MFVEAGELREAQAALEREREEREKAAEQAVDSVIRDLIRPPTKAVEPR
jgi:hypothetical protein